MEIILRILFRSLSDSAKLVNVFVFIVCEFPTDIQVTWLARSPLCGR